jgi:hypothetical protein
VGASYFKKKPVSERRALCDQMEGQGTERTKERVEGLSPDRTEPKFIDSKLYEEDWEGEVERNVKS